MFSVLCPFFLRERTRHGIYIYDFSHEKQSLGGGGGRLLIRFKFVTNHLNYFLIALKK